MSRSLQSRQQCHYSVPEWQQTGFSGSMNGLQAAAGFPQSCHGDFRNSTACLPPPYNVNAVYPQEAYVHQGNEVYHSPDSFGYPGFAPPMVENAVRSNAYSVNASNNRSSTAPAKPPLPAHKRYAYTSDRNMSQYVVPMTKTSAQSQSNTTPQRFAYASNSNMSQYVVPMTKTSEESSTAPPSNQPPTATSMAKPLNNVSHKIPEAPNDTAVRQRMETTALAHSSTLAPLNLSSPPSQNGHRNSLAPTTEPGQRASTHSPNTDTLKEKEIRLERPYMTYHDDLGLLNRSLLCALEDSITVEPRLNLVENDPTSDPYFADWLTNTCEEHTIRSTAYSIPSIPCNAAFGSAFPVNPNDRLSLFSLPTTSQLVYPVNYARTHSASSMNDSADSQIGEIKDMAADMTFGSVAGERGSGSPRETYLNQPLRRLASSPTPSSDFQTELEAVTKRPLLSEEDSQPRVKLGQRFDGAASIPLSPHQSSSLDGQTELETATKSPFKVGRGTLSFTRRATRGTGKKIPLATVKATAERFRPRLCIKMSSQAEPTKVVIDEDLAEQLRPYVQESRYPSHTSKTKSHTYESSQPAAVSCQEETCNDADDEGGAEDA